MGIFDKTREDEFRGQRGNELHNVRSGQRQNPDHRMTSTERGHRTTDEETGGTASHDRSFLGRWIFGR